jgi:hypothetical protein
MGSTSKYTGVSWRQRERKWDASVVYQGIKHLCGYHETEELAVKARDRRILALGLPTKLLQKFKPANNETTNP